MEVVKKNTDIIMIISSALFTTMKGLFSFS